jgi:hypothetical protein
MPKAIALIDASTSCLPVSYLEQVQAYMTRTLRNLQMSSIMDLLPSGGFKRTAVPMHGAVDGWEIVCCRS